MQEKFQMYKPSNKMKIKYSVKSLSGPTEEEIEEWEYRQEMENRIQEKLEEAEQAIAELEEIIEEMIEYDALDYEIGRMIEVYHKWKNYYYYLESI